MRERVAQQRILQAALVVRRNEGVERRLAAAELEHRRSRHWPRVSRMPDNDVHHPGKSEAHMANAHDNPQAHRSHNCLKVASICSAICSTIAE